ncbi:uncharacterized protein DS421_4g121070 [Arachis hypogaea]|nr:uncharacterized protein DS421_4g121070 [Arachis hypogaea]
MLFFSNVVNSSFFSSVGFGVYVSALNEARPGSVKSVFKAWEERLNSSGRHPHHSSTASLATILSILTLKNDFKQLEVFLIKWFSLPKSLIYNVLFASNPTISEVLCSSNMIKALILCEVFQTLLKLYRFITYVRYEFECLPGYMKGLATWERLRAIYELRLNSPTTFEMPLEVLGHELQFTQDPNSKHLGTKVWDSSLVFAKFLERNCRKGRFSPAKLKGKRVIELGTGYGVSGFGNVTNDF